ncbi:hypothetical protein ACFPH6_19965 [Streptomyces xiangluensis]|uniref:Uncharacterized protein n=1 Tax=Streptomyces xiangluensis TaxID=2665720 RepID=A0ABV8YNB2_9ACTN
METGTSTDIESPGVKPEIMERGPIQGARAVPSARGGGRDDRREQEPVDLQSNIILGED